MSLTQGSGQLFTDPSANAAREYFRSKDRSMTDKVMTVQEAVDRFIQDNDYLALGGFGANRIPTAVAHEILRQQKQMLAFAGHTATHDFQILCAGNLIGEGQTLAKVDIAYIVGLEARGLSPHARRVMQSGTVEVTEWTNFALATRLKAAAMGVPFLPSRTMLGTDTFNKSGAKIIECPFTGEKLTALPALFPDVAAIHVHEADHNGNCRIHGTSVADLELARAAKKLIITCERLISNDVIRQEPSRTLIPYWCVDAVCEVPYGSYPGNMPYEYFSDEDHIKLWLQIEQDIEQFKAFIQMNILEVEEFSQYLELCGGLKRMQQLRAQEMLL